MDTGWLEDTVQLGSEPEMLDRETIGDSKNFDNLENVSEMPLYVTLSDLDICPGDLSMPLNLFSSTLASITETPLINDAEIDFKIDESQTQAPQEGPEDEQGYSSKKQKGQVDLETLWTEPGADWSNVKPSKEERREHHRKRIGLAACKTGPQCFTCGEPLELEELLGVGCPVCYCFN
ncbi:hypothetical protein F5X99DRAFT_391152 [Biscogniauxia marginata]|nr:hypothetical protein F5X99DRAFT_391152 [Biscogniauxia marginata]